ncbi:MAG: hypothetical protein LBL30_01155 [Holosporales bacterium]|nr:hypothetical protein [Holosporales bacterium]
MDGASISPEQRESIYKDTVTFWPPSSTNPCNPALSQQEQDGLSQDGLNFISTRIKEKADDVAIFLIPKSLYQLFVMEELNHDFLISASNSDIRGVARKFTRKIESSSFALQEKLTIEDDGRETISAEYRKYVLKQPVKEAFWGVNDFAVNFIEKLKIDVLNPTSDQMSDIINVLLKCTKTSADLLYKTKIPTSMKEIDSLTVLYGAKLVELFFKPLIDGRTDSIQRLITYCVSREYNFIEDTPKTTVYRGGGFPDDVRHNARSLSDGLFGGMIRDGETGCAFTYALQTGVLYCADIELSWLTDPECPIFIPALHSLGAAYGYFELHHPRIKLLCCDTCDMMSCQIDDVDGFSNLSDVLWLRTKNAAGTIKVLRAMKQIFWESEPFETSPQKEIEEAISQI